MHFFKLTSFALVVCFGSASVPKNFCFTCGFLPSAPKSFRLSATSWFPLRCLDNNFGFPMPHVHLLFKKMSALSFCIYMVFKGLFAFRVSASTSPPLSHLHAYRLSRFFSPLFCDFSSPFFMVFSASACRRFCGRLTILPNPPTLVKSFFCLFNKNLRNFSRL